MRYRVGIREYLSAAHRIEDHQGPCRNLHGHTYIVDVEVESNSLNEMNMVVDIIVLRKIVRDVIEVLDHTYLNEVFKDKNVTSELIAVYILEHICTSLKALGIKFLGIKVRIYETPTSWVEVEYP
ncbi:MAG: 6-carboxytetrahydropterin synthase QueD [Ignisphaera sp.]|uniref:6-carboxytetrahydropterin synthase QueD n=1 Tax=Ignisphaera aggregans TaxID=334771 RepID=A0A7J3MZT5_9CREN